MTDHFMLGPIFDRFGLLRRLQGTDRYKYLHDCIEQFRAAGIAAQLQYARYLIENWLDSQPIEEEAQRLFSERNDNSLPYENFELNPRQVSQTKKVINALFLGEKAVYELENMNIGSISIEQLLAIFMDVSRSIQLATHLDLDFADCFRDHENILIPIKNKFSTFSESNQIRADRFMAKISENSLPALLGEGVGQVIDSMGRGKRADGFFNDQALIMNFSRWINNSLDLITDHLIGQEEESELVKAIKLDAMNLMEELSDICNEGLSFTKLLKQIKRLLQIKQRFLSLCHQGGLLNEEIQAALFDCLDQLKRKWAPLLIDVAFRLEELLLLEHGSYSLPLINLLESHYKEYFPYINTLIPTENDENAHYQTMIDHSFLANCAKYPYQRLKEHQAALSKVLLLARLWDRDWALRTLEKISGIEESSQEGVIHKYSNKNFKNRNIAQMSDRQLEEFISYYQACQSYIREVSPDLDEEIFQSIKVRSTTSQTLWQQIRSKVGRGDLDKLLSLDSQVKNKFLKDAKNLSYLVSFNQKQIRGIYHSQLGKVPDDLPLKSIDLYNTQREFSADDVQMEALRIFRRDDETELQGEQEDKNTTICKHVGELKKRAVKVDISLTYFNLFISIWDQQNTKKNKTFTLEQRRQLRKHYYYFRTFILERCFTNDKQRFMAIDQEVLLLTSEKNYKKKALQARSFFANKSEIASAFESASLELRNARASLLNKIEKNLFENRVLPENLSEPIEKEFRYRVLKEANISEDLSAFKFQLYNCMSFFSDTIQEGLRPYNQGVPFPETENPIDDQKETEHFKILKRLHNAVYYLEQLARSFEELDDRAWEQGERMGLWKPYWQIAYFHNSIFIYLYYAKLKSIITDLVFDPFFKQLSDEIQKQFKVFLQILNAHGQPYLINGVNDNNNGCYEIKYEGLFKTINALFYAPTHIKSLNYHFQVSDNERLEVTEKARTVTYHIEWISSAINQSPWLGVILSSPKILSVYQQAAKQLTILRDVSYDAAISRLSEIRSDFLSTLVDMIDQYEERFAIKPVVSKNFSDLSVSFFDGLVSQLAIAPDDRLNILFDGSWLDRRLDLLTKRRSKLLIELSLAREKVSFFETYNEKIASLLKNGKFATDLTTRKLIAEISSFYLEHYLTLQRFDSSLTEDYLNSFFKGEELFEGERLKPLMYTSTELSSSYLEEKEDKDIKSKSIRVLPLKRIKVANYIYQGEFEKLTKVSNAFQLLTANAQGKVQTILMTLALYDERKRFLETQQQELSAANDEKRIQFVESSYIKISQLLIVELEGLSPHLKQQFHHNFRQKLDKKKTLIIKRALESRAPFSELEHQIKLEFERYKERELLSFITINKVQKLAIELEAYLNDARHIHDTGVGYETAQSLSHKRACLRKICYILSLVQNESASSVLMRLQKAIYQPNFLILKEADKGISNPFFNNFSKLRYILYDSSNFYRLTGEHFLSDFKGEIESHHSLANKFTLPSAGIDDAYPINQNQMIQPFNL